MKTLTFLITLVFAVIINPMFIDDSITEPITGTDSNIEESSGTIHHQNSVNDNFNIVFSMSSLNFNKGTENIVQQMYSTELHIDNLIDSRNKDPDVYTNSFLTSMVDE